MGIVVFIVVCSIFLLLAKNRNRDVQDLEQEAIKTFRSEDQTKEVQAKQVTTLSESYDSVKTKELAVSDIKFAEKTLFVTKDIIDLTPQTTSQKKYSPGNYLVGEDLKEGEYIVFSDDEEMFIKIKGQLQRKERVEFSCIGSCIVKLCQWDKIELRNGYMAPLEEEMYQPKHNQVYMLKVGKHIQAGEYELSQVDSSRFAVYYLMNDSMLQFDQVVDADAIFGKTTIYISDGQYIYLENAQLEKLK